MLNKKKLTAAPQIDDIDIIDLCCTTQKKPLSISCFQQTLSHIFINLEFFDDLHHVHRY
jgi:hypothetical protein